MIPYQVISLVISQSMEIVLATSWETTSRRMPHSTRAYTTGLSTAGMKQEQMVILGNAIVEILRKRNSPEILDQLRTTVNELAAEFPAYPIEFNGHV